MSVCRSVICAVVMAAALPTAATAADFASADLDFLGRGRAAGLGAGPGRIDNLFWSPSGLAWRSGGSGEGFAGWMDYLAGLKGALVGYAGAERGGRALGGFVAYLSSGAVPLTTWDDPAGGRGETFTWSEISCGLAGGAMVLPRTSVGAGLKVVRQSIEHQAATALLGDLSTTTMLRRAAGAGGIGLYACLAARNLVAATWGTGSDPTSGCIETGLAADLGAGSATAACSVLLGRAGRREASLGLAAVLGGQFELRLGYTRSIGACSDASFDFGWQRGLAAGFGVGLGRFWFDYTYEDATPLDGIHRLVLRSAAAD